jgi:hypothetical protein
VSEALVKNRKLAVDSAKAEKIAEKAEGESMKQYTEGKPSDGKLVIAEEVVEGHVGWNACQSVFISPQGCSLILIVKIFFGGVSRTHPVLFWFAFASGLLLVDLLASIETWWLGQWAEQYVLYPGWKVAIS